MPQDTADLRAVGLMKRYIAERGFGFITGPGGQEYWFHGTQLSPGYKPQERDVVTFIPHTATDGRLQARSISLSQRADPPPQSRPKNSRPYYGETTYRYEKNENYMTPAQGALGLAIVGAVVGYFALGGNWFSSTLLAVLGAWGGWRIALKQKDGPYIRGNEITSVCLKCGGVGQVTATDGRYYGFQCQECLSHWKKRTDSI